MAPFPRPFPTMINSMVVKFASARDALNLRAALLGSSVEPSFKHCISRRGTPKPDSQFPLLHPHHTLLDRDDFQHPPLGLPGSSDDLIPYLNDLFAYDVLHAPEVEWELTEITLYWRKASKSSISVNPFFLEYSAAVDTNSQLTRKRRCLMKTVGGTVSHLMISTF